MSPERPGRWVSLRQGPGKSWQLIQGLGVPGQPWGARLGGAQPHPPLFPNGIAGLPQVDRGGLRHA